MVNDEMIDAAVDAALNVAAVSDRPRNKHLRLLVISALFALILLSLAYIIARLL